MRAGSGCLRASSGLRLLAVLAVAGLLLLSVVTALLGAQSSVPARAAQVGPGLALSQDAPSSVVGETVQLKATVTQCTGAVVDFEVLSGPNAGTPVTNNGDGTASYVGKNAGTDIIEARFITYGGRTISAKVTHVWTAESPPIEVHLTGPSSGVIGTPVTVEATVTGSTGGSVTFYANEEAFGKADAPPFTAPFSPDLAGDYSLYAVYTAPDGRTQRSNDLQQHWDPVVQLSGPDGETRYVDAEDESSVATWTATVIGGGETGVTFKVTGANPQEPMPGVLQGDGTYKFSYHGTNVGVDTVVAVAAMRSGGDIPSDPATVTWEYADAEGEPSVDPSASPTLNSQSRSLTRVPAGPVVCDPSLELAPDGQSSPIGTDFTATATVLEAGEPLGGVPVTFSTTMVGAPGRTLPTVTSDSGGHAGATLGSDRAGLETVTASVALPGFSDVSILHTWLDTDHPLLVVTLGPGGVSSLAGQPFEVTAVVTDESDQPVPGADVHFRASMPGAPDRVGDGTTDGSGISTFQLTRHVAGHEHITAEASSDGRSGVAAVTHEWVKVPGLKLRLVPDHLVSRVGRAFTATAILGRGGAPLAGKKLQFAATIGGEHRLAHDQRTDARGRAQFSYTRHREGVDDVVVTYSLEDGTDVEAGIVHVWRHPRAHGHVHVQGHDVPPRPHGLKLEMRSAPPGADVGATGYGCAPFSRVLVAFDGHSAATPLTTAQGTYRAVVHVGQNTKLGDYVVTATCGDTTSSAPLGIAVASSSGGTAPASLVTSGAVLSFFVLLGGQLLRLGGPLYAPPTG